MKTFEEFLHDSRPLANHTKRQLAKLAWDEAKKINAMTKHGDGTFPKANEVEGKHGWSIDTDLLKQISTITGEINPDFRTFMEESECVLRAIEQLGWKVYKDL